MLRMGEESIAWTYLIMSFPYYIRAQVHDAADDFMAGDDGQFRIGQFAIDHMKIRPADRAGGYANAYLARLQRARCDLSFRKRQTGPVEHHGAHVQSGAFSL